MPKPKIDEAWIALCDSAQVISGKLYMLGGAWSRIVVSESPVMMALAIHILGDFKKTEEHDFRAALYKGKELYRVDNHEIVIVGKFAGERVDPPTKLPSDVNIAVQFAVLLVPGNYTWELTVDGDLTATNSFDVVRALAASSERRPSQNAGHL
jgi:hypothetical protein